MSSPDAPIDIPNPMTALARKLQSRGNEAVFIGLPDAGPIVRAANLNSVPFCEKEDPVGSVAKGYAPLAKLHGLHVVEHSQIEVPGSSPENAARFGLPAHGWTLHSAVMDPNSRGRIRLTGPNASDPIQIETNFLSHPDDLKVALASVELAREIGNSAPLRPYAKRQMMPGNLKGPVLENFVRDAAVTWWHETCTAKMGRDAMSVVDGTLKVYGIDKLRIADGSILPRVTTGNTMAPCVVIGVRAAELLKKRLN